MILFGGQDDFFTYYSDVWALNLMPTTAAMTTPPVNYWTQLTPSGVPPDVPSARIGHSAIYDSQNNRMIVFGGQDGGGYRNDIHILTLGGTPAWSAPAITGTPPSGRMGHSAVYDAANQRMVIFGGDTAVNPITPTNELWSLRLDASSTWTFLNPVSGTPPAARYAHSAIYDSGSQRMVIYGGNDNSGFPSFGETWLTDF